MLEHLWIRRKIVIQTSAAIGAKLQFFGYRERPARIHGYVPPRIITSWASNSIEGIEHSYKDNGKSDQRKNVKFAIYMGQEYSDNEYHESGVES